MRLHMPVTLSGLVSATLCGCLLGALWYGGEQFVKSQVRVVANAVVYGWSDSSRLVAGAVMLHNNLTRMDHAFQNMGVKTPNQRVEQSFDSLPKWRVTDDYSSRG